MYPSLLKHHRPCRMLIGVMLYPLVHPLQKKPIQNKTPKLATGYS